MQRWSRAARVWCGVSCLGLLGLVAAMPPAEAAGITVRVTPDRDLVSGQSVTVSGHGLGKPPGSGAPTWFVTECTAAVRGRMNPATDTPHCDITDAEAVKLSETGTFKTHFRVTAGIVGDGYCGTPGHATCVIAVGTAAGKGTIVAISFRVPNPSAPAAPTGATGATS